jgi:hypothetical protein
MYSPFDLDIGAVIRESADRIIETLNTDRTDDGRVDSDDASTLDFIVVDVPALPESCDHGAEELLLRIMLSNLQRHRRTATAICDGHMRRPYATAVRSRP